jgi:aryl-alcohol dehydrogenase-like predicted oxidoreductase
MAHRTDPEVPIAETLETFGNLAAAGQIRYAGCSNYSAQDLEAALSASATGGTGYAVCEPHYNS